MNTLIATVSGIKKRYDKKNIDRERKGIKKRALKRKGGKKIVV